MLALKKGSEARGQAHLPDPELHLIEFDGVIERLSRHTARNCLRSPGRKVGLPCCFSHAVRHRTYC